MQGREKTDGLDLVGRKTLAAYQRAFGTTFVLDKTKSVIDTADFARNHIVLSIDDIACAVLDLLDVADIGIGNALADGEGGIAMVDEGTGEGKVVDAERTVGTVLACVSENED